MIHTIKSHWDQLINNLLIQEEHFVPFYLEWFAISEIMAHIHKQKLHFEENAEIVRLIMETIHFEMMHELLSHIPEEYHETVVVRVHHSEPLKRVLNTIDVADYTIERNLQNKATEVQSMLLAILEEGI